MTVIVLCTEVGAKDESSLREVNYGGIDTCRLTTLCLKQVLSLNSL